MSAFDNSLASSTSRAKAAAPVAITGGRRAKRGAQLPINTFDTGPRMVLDTGIHWTWRNPLNLIPATVLLLELISLVGMALR
jgi:hypothetical protein